MKTGQTEQIGDGAYLHFDGLGFELRATTTTMVILAQTGINRLHNRAVTSPALGGPLDDFPFFDAFS